MIDGVYAREKTQYELLEKTDTTDAFAGPVFP